MAITTGKRASYRRIGASPLLGSAQQLSGFSLHSGVGDCSALPDRTAINACKQDTIRRLQRAWIERLTFGPTPLEDRLIQLWLGIFPVNQRQLGGMASLLVQQIEAIRSNLNGTYPALLSAMVANPALQISLDGLRNRSGRPNENLGRELLELFTLGEGNYSERDVSEAARALTGYRLQTDGTLAIDPRRHDDGPKTILGRTARFNGPSLVAWLCEQHATAQHLTSRLWLRLVGPMPSSSRIAAIARSWQARNLSIPWLIEAILQTPEAAASLRTGAMLRDPLDLVVASLALIGSRHPEAFAAARIHLGRMGQMLFEPPSVKGWPVNEQWLSLRGLQARRRFLQSLLADAEVWASRSLPNQLTPSLTPIQPLTLRLPAKPGRDTLAQLFNDPVWQLK